MLIDQAGLAELEPVAELEPGVPISRASFRRKGELLLVTKAGGFGSPEVFLKVLGNITAGSCTKVSAKRRGTWYLQ
jgi:uncharacterized protein YgbK (DUF1537 family)